MPDKLHCCSQHVGCAVWCVCWCAGLLGGTCWVACMWPWFTVACSPTDLLLVGWVQGKQHEEQWQHALHAMALCEVLYTAVHAGSAGLTPHRHMLHTVLHVCVCVSIVVPLCRVYTAVHAVRLFPMPCATCSILECMLVRLCCCRCATFSTLQYMRVRLFWCSCVECTQWYMRCRGFGVSHVPIRAQVHRNSHSDSSQGVGSCCEALGSHML
jgi:hypothetical protein